MIHLVIGGARSGKSSFAEQWSLQQPLPNDRFHYIATATGHDDEMCERIKQHQQSRSAHWQLHECPLALTQQLQETTPASLYLVDCLTLWLNNVIFSLDENMSYQEKQLSLQTEREQLVAQLVTMNKENVTIVLVTNEVGLGIVPMGEVSRLFVDHAGWLNQAIAKIADQVTLLTAGIPLSLKAPKLAKSLEVPKAE